MYDSSDLSGSDEYYNNSNEMSECFAWYFRVDACNVVNDDGRECDQVRDIERDAIRCFHRKINARRRRSSDRYSNRQQIHNHDKQQNPWMPGVKHVALCLL